MNTITPSSSSSSLSTKGVDLIPKKSNMISDIAARITKRQHPRDDKDFVPHTKRQCLDIDNDSTSPEHLSSSSDSSMLVPITSTITKKKKSPRVRVSSAQPRPLIYVLPRGIGPVKDPNVNDVLSGRGGRVNAHCGNVQFRDMVAQYKLIYLNENTKKLDKARIAADIVYKIRCMDPPGRFLKQDNPNDEGSEWYDIGDQRAIKKVGQALREDAPEIRDGSNDTTFNTVNKGFYHGSLTPLSSMSPSIPHLPNLTSVHSVNCIDSIIRQKSGEFTKETIKTAKKSVDANLEPLSCPKIIVPPRGIGPIEKPNENDVLSGRGGRINVHPGNIRFREIVSKRKPEYQSNTVISKKANIAADIVHQLRSTSAKFLKQDPEDKCWYDIGDQRAIMKVEQALRETDTTTNTSKCYETTKNHPIQDTSRSQPISSIISCCASSCVSDICNSSTSTIGEKPTKWNASLKEVKPVFITLARQHNDKNHNNKNFVQPHGYGPIREPNNNDVLSGRGYRVNIHPGNVQFRDIVARRKHEYMAAQRNMEKLLIASSIVEQIRRDMEPPGRFLKYENFYTPANANNKSSSTSNSGSWYDIGDEQAIKKVGQALRENSHF